MKIQHGLVWDRIIILFILFFGISYYSLYHNKNQQKEDQAVFVYNLNEIESGTLQSYFELQPPSSIRRGSLALHADGLQSYATDRDRPDKPGTSRMSAHLKFGTVHPRTLAADLDVSDPGAAAYLRELAFRDFYAAVLQQWPASAWRNFNAAFDTIEVDSGADAEAAFEAWKQGRTGFPIVDAGMRQLLATGFMHNRVRMIVASFAVKDLHLPWQWGARWFMEQLVDADVASNQHGWQWCAGSGTDAAPYFRVFNPTAQGEKFDPSGDYVRRWVPELDGPTITGADVHRLKAGRPAGYPEPIVDHAAERNEALRRYGQLG
jgi:deoxyribodipyrimidine photo-lyase